MATISTTRETRITKDKANILNMKQCNIDSREFDEYLTTTLEYKKIKLITDYFLIFILFLYILNPLY